MVPISYLSRAPIPQTTDANSPLSKCEDLKKNKKAKKNIFIYSDSAANTKRCKM